ncbi:MAG: bacteriohemerythrin [Firmicutes bacterium]|nr:bacteriohemerythrin [Bacillota bacterium]
MSWDPSLNTGIEEVDNQHMKLLETIERLAEVNSREDERDALESILVFLEGYVINHFATEEELHKVYDYPKRDLHKHLHDDLIKDMEDLKVRIDEEGLSPEVMKETNEFLMSWIINHISNSDMDFAGYYRSVTVGA